jgi:pimeloyl-ACP methyl ester carboxylesterase
MVVKPAEVAKIAAKRGIELKLQLMGANAKYWFYPASTPSRGNIVFVHGFRGAHDGLHTIIGELTDFDCYAPDLPGYGVSEALTVEHDLDNFSTWLGEFISALKLEGAPAVVGHSFGTMIVAAHAAEQKQDMDDVVLINPVSKPSLQGPRAFISGLTSMFFLFTSKLSEKGSRFFVDSWLVLQFVSSIMSKSKNRELRKWIHNQHHQTMINYSSKKVFYESYHASVHHCVEEYAPRIENRTLMIAGERDDITSVEQQTEVSAKMPNAKLVVIPKVGHLVHYEASEEAASLIRAFLTEAK